MTFEEILPGLKAKKKYVRTGWGGAENYVQLFDTIEQNGVALEVTPYFLINVSGEGEGFSMWSPTPCVYSLQVLPQGLVLHKLAYFQKKGIKFTVWIRRIILTCKVIFTFYNVI